ncbi:MAG: glycosyltransferase family 39 protein [Chloroflexota bacterium]
MSNRYRILALIVMLAGFGLRLHLLGAESLWYDETVSVVLAQKPIPEMLEHTAGDIHPPGYYLVLHLWNRIAQAEHMPGIEFLFAWPSLCFGLLILPLLFCLAKKFYGYQVALITITLGAINPFHIWYGQEVRMYTIGAILGLLCLWALCRYWDDDSDQVGIPAFGWLLIYTLSGAVGLYVLYYFAFTLMGLNLVALWLWFQARRRKRGVKPNWVMGQAIGWVGAQIGILALWSPWLPIFWHQATDPPVPPWREVWSWQRLGPDLLESASALIAGQSLDGLWVLVTGIVGLSLLLLFPFANKAIQQSYPRSSLQSAIPKKKYSEQGSASSILSSSAATIILIYIVAPTLLIYLLTALVTPLYHVRYLFTYAPPMMIAVAVALVWLLSPPLASSSDTERKRNPSSQGGTEWSSGIRRGKRVGTGSVNDVSASFGRLRGRWFGAVLLCAILWFNGYSLYNFWYAPAYRSDNHRGAVLDLANRWRPGDLILVNAGWAYPPLQIYWPTVSSQDVQPIPPPLLSPVRLVDKVQGSSTTDDMTGNSTTNEIKQPLIVRSGSVSGPASLGWGDPNSDFFAISPEETIQALDAIATCTHRLWHYRIYDTVSDPTGIIRQWLEERAVLWQDDWIGGRDLGRLQLYEISSLPNVEDPNAKSCPQEFGSAATKAFDDIDFGNALQPQQIISPQNHMAGFILYTEITWNVLTGLADEPSALSMSLRLYDSQDQQIAQQDESPQPGTDQWLVGTKQRQSLALPIPFHIAPGVYTLELIVYRQVDGTPLALPERPETTWGQRLLISPIEIEPSQTGNNRQQ